MATIINQPIITVSPTGSTVSPDTTLVCEFQEKYPTFTGDFLTVPGSSQSIQTYQAGFQVTLPTESVAESGDQATLRLVITAGSSCVNTLSNQINYTVLFQGEPTPCTSVTLRYVDSIDIPNDDNDPQRTTVVDNLCNESTGTTDTYYLNVSSVDDASILLIENITISTSGGCNATAATGWYSLRFSGTDCVGGYWDGSQFKYARPCSTCLGVSP
jgi:hypothetical protein